MATINAIGSNKPIETAFGGTGQSTLTNHGVLVGAATSAVTQLSVGTNGQVLVGSSAADPVFATLTTDSSPATLAYTTGAGTLQIKVNHSTKVTTFTGNGTFTIDSRTNWVKIYGWSGGNGGGSGRKGATTAAGGGGGGGCGASFVYESPATIFNPAGEIVTIGGQANGGIAVTADSTNGNPGSALNTTSIGNISLGDGQGGTVSTAGVGTGGTTGFGGNSNAGSAYIYGATVSASPGAGGSGSAASASQPVAIGKGTTTTALSTLFPSSGGGGGGADSGTARTGAQGGNRQSIDGTINIILGGTGGTIDVGAGGIKGGDGNPSATTGCVFTGGTGAGGGSGQFTVGAGLKGGAGGDGGIPGGGGGGGGGGLNTGDSTGGSGAGGKGARGQIIVIEFF